MRESAVGAISPAIRQNGGRLGIVLVVPGGTNDPAVTACATVIFVAGSDRSERLAQDAAEGCACAGEPAPSTSNTMPPRLTAVQMGIRIFVTPASLRHLQFAANKIAYDFTGFMAETQLPTFNEIAPCHLA